MTDSITGSILTSDTLRLLYNLANRPGAMESATMAFWMHYLCKHVFPEDYWVVAQEQEPSEASSLRRVDTKIQYSNGLTLKIIAICEAKRAGSSPTAVEAQLVEACQTAAKGGNHPYGIAILGTSIKFFQWIAGSRWIDITSRYEDANSENNGIRAAFKIIRSSVQNPQAGYGVSQRVQASSQVSYGQPLTIRGSTTQPSAAPLMESPARLGLLTIKPSQSPKGRAVEITYNGKSFKLIEPKRHLFVRSVGYYEVSYDTSSLTALNRVPEDVQIVCVAEEGYPVRKVTDKAWYQLNKATGQWLALQSS